MARILEDPSIRQEDPSIPSLEYWSSIPTIKYQTWVDAAVKYASLPNDKEWSLLNDLNHYESFSTQTLSACALKHF